jgi:WD40 repeat protein
MFVPISIFDPKSASFSPDGHQFAVSGKGVAVWDTVTFNKIADLSPSFARPEYYIITGVSYSPDGLKLAATEKGLIKIWNTRTWKETVMFESPERNEAKVHFSPDGQNLMVAQSNSFSVWNLKTEELLYKNRIDNQSAVYSPDGTHIAAASSLKRVTVWEADTGLEVINFNWNDGIGLVFYSPDGENLAVVGMDGKVGIWDTNTWENTLIFSTHRLHHGSYSPDGRNIITAGNDATARIWNVITGEEIATLFHDKPVKFAGYSPDGNSIITVTVGEAMTIVWDSQIVLGGGEFIAKEGAYGERYE